MNESMNKSATFLSSGVICLLLHQSRNTLRKFEDERGTSTSRPLKNVKYRMQQHK